MSAGRKGPVVIQVALEVLIGLLLLASSFRLLGVLILFLYAIIRTVGWPHSTRLALCLGLLFIIGIAAPIDLSLGNRYTLCGAPGRGLRFVPVVFGLPNHVYLHGHYKEYACGGCCAPIIQPKWVLTWN